MTDKTCAKCKYVAQYPFLDPCFQCIHHSGFEPMEKKEVNNGSDTSGRLPASSS